MPRPLRVIGIPVAGVLLVLFFVYLGFPYHRLGDIVAFQAGRALGARVAIQEVGPRLALAGPGFEARGVRVTWDSGRVLQLDRAAVRPAWSLAWLRGSPALYAELESPDGAVEGVWATDGAWEGELLGVDLSAVPFDVYWPGVAPRGRIDARVDLRPGEEGPEGDVEFEATDGSLQLPDVPIPLPYEVCSGSLVFGGQSLVEIESFSLEGPVLSASGKGTVGRGRGGFQSAPLALELQLTAKQPAVQSVLRSAGISLDRNGSSRVRISGTPSAPRVR